MGELDRSGRTRGLRALVVEDELLTAWDLCAMLEDMGFGLCEATTSDTEALGLVERLHPQVVIMDIRIRGELDGIAVARRIREKTAVPIVFAGGYIPPQVQPELQALGAAVLEKPILKSALQAAVRRALRQRPDD